jgi:DNA mismatch repair protein MutL
MPHASAQINTEQALCLIDQKAAHARVIFESMQVDMPNKSDVQFLLLPYTFELSLAESDVLRKSAEKLHQIGIHIHEFGPQTFKIDAIPQIFGNVDMQQFVDELLQSLQTSSPKENLFQDEMRRQIAIKASRCAVSMRQRLPQAEAQALINQWIQCKQPQFCPQGRPTCLKLTIDDIAKNFQKLGG